MIENVPVIVTDIATGRSISINRANADTGTPGQTHVIWRDHDIGPDLAMRAAQIGDPLIEEQTFGHDEYTVIVDGIIQNGLASPWKLRRVDLLVRIGDDLRFLFVDQGRDFTVSGQFRAKDTPKDVAAVLHRMARDVDTWGKS